MISFLAAFRPENEHRALVWEYLQTLYAREFPNAEVVVGTDDGEDPFHKTLALNRAAEMAKGDVFVIIDCDTWTPRTQVLQSVAELQESGTWGRPWNIKLKLGQADTARTMGNPFWEGAIDQGMAHPSRRENLNTYWGAPPQVLTREQFYAVGGLDERFRGWGQEDEAFVLALRCLVGRPKHVIGYAVHLWHPRIGKSGNDWWPGQERTNKGLVLQYQRAAQSPTRMAEVIRRRQEPQ